MSIRRELISNALHERFRELCTERISQLKPEKFGEDEAFVSQVREQLLNASPGEISDATSGMSAPGSWMASDTDCLASLRALSLGEPLRFHPASRPPLGPFIERLTTSRADPARRFQLLAERYSCPLNFTLQAEDEAREHVLARLMSHDRARIEGASVEAVNADDLLLKLSLLALHAARVPDVRFLDTLNYYYELLPRTWQPQTLANWLLASYFALYSRALATRIL